VSSGQDCGWVDYIVFPPLNITNPFDPPVELEAEIIDYNSAITVSWGGADRLKEISRDLIGYNIYFDGVFVEYVSNGPFTINGPFAEGDYLIGVSAVYDEGESEITEITATVVLDPPINLEAMSSGDNIILSWDPPSPARGIIEYKIYRDDLEIGTTTETTYTDPTIQSGNYTYGVSVIFDGGFESDVTEIDIEHTDASDLTVPTITELRGNYPNPFNPSTNISFSTTQAGHVSIRIYNMRGQLVKTLLNEDLEAAYHNIAWNGKDKFDNDVSSGIYFYNMRTENYNSTKKMILMK